MRKLIMSAAAVGIVVAGGGITAIVSGGSPTTAAPLPALCGSFAGSGPAPDCSYRLTERALQVSLRNNARGPGPVVCNLLWPLADRPLSSTSMGPGERGSLSAPAAAGVQRYTVDCHSVVPVADAVARTVTLTVTVPGYSPSASSSRTRWTPPQPNPTSTRWSAPSRTRSPRFSLPTVAPTTEQPTVTRERVRPSRPLLPNTMTTTTTTPVR